MGVLAHAVLYRHPCSPPLVVHAGTGTPCQADLLARLWLAQRLCCV